MPSITKASFLLVSVAIARLASADELRVFPQAGCDSGGYYDTIETVASSCSETWFSDSDYNTTSANSNIYQAYFSLLTTEATGCGVVIGQGSSDAADPPCGECILLMHDDATCIQATLPSPYYAWQCCGQDCETQCGQIPGKRTIADAAETKAKPAIANLKNRSPLSSLPKVNKRADCSFSKSGDLFSSAGDPVKVSGTYTACPSSDGCTEEYSGTVESSFSQTFDVSESTEAGLFDIVSETVSFGYNATWESSQSVTISGSYPFSEGQSGYITFTPLSQCVLGTFAGDDCASMNIPTGGQARQACVPEKIAVGQINGDFNVVTTA